jgi:uncharacterized membrane protein
MTVSEVRARRPSNRPIRRLWFDERVTPSLWFVPSLFVIVSFIVSRIVISVDRARSASAAPSWLLGADSSAAASFASIVAAAMLSFAAVVFSTTLVAIQLAGGQYSPRVVRVFVRSRLTQVTLGVFLATFVFAISGVVEERGGDNPYVPAITLSIVYVLVYVTVFTFIAFVFGMSRLLRAQYLIERVTRDARPLLLAAFSTDGTVPAALNTDTDAGIDTSSVMVHSTRHVGVIQAIDVAGLVQRMQQRGTVVEVLVEAGEYVGTGTQIARIAAGDAASVSPADISQYFLLGAERTLLHDLGFVFRQLVDIAIRALSPAVNDPTTAVQCIDRIDDLLDDVLSMDDPTAWYVDSDGRARVHLTMPGLQRLLLLSYLEIIRYGADSPQVVRRLHAALDGHERVARDDLQATLTELRTMLTEYSSDVLPASFRSRSLESDRHGLG